MKGKDEWNHRLYLYLFFFQLDIGPLKEQKQWKIPIQQLLIANNTYFWWFFGKPLFFPFSFSRFRKDLQSVLFFLHPILFANTWEDCCTTTGWGRGGEGRSFALEIHLFRRDEKPTKSSKEGKKTPVLFFFFFFPFVFLMLQRKTLQLEGYYSLSFFLSFFTDG